MSAREAKLEEALRGCIPWVASSGRGMAQESLAVACELLDIDPYDWTYHPDVLTRRREVLGMPDRRKADEWRGLYPMCLDPEACRGRSSCPRDPACDH